MSKYLDRLKKFSENKNLIYADKPWLKAIAHIEQIEKENAELKLQLDIAHKFYGELLSEIPKGLAEFKGLSLKDMADYYLKKLEQLKDQGE